VSLGLLAVLLLITNVAAAAPSWTAPTTLRTKTNLFLGSADFLDTRVGIAWDEPAPGGRRVGLRTSMNSGASFASSIYLSDSINPEVDICDSTNVDLAWQHEIAPDVWNVQYTSMALGGSSFVTHPVGGGLYSQHDPDVACYANSAAVAWYESVSEGVDNMYVAYGSRTTGTFATPIYLGQNDNTLYFGSLAVGAADGYTYAAFAKGDGDLRLRRSTVTGGASPTVSLIGTQVIANGTHNNQASNAKIAAEGSKVVVVWQRCQGIFGRVSNDHGATWGPVRTLFDEFNSCDADAAAGVDSVATRDGRIAVSFGIASAFGGGENRLIRSSNDFASITDDVLSSSFHQTEIVGFVTVSGNRKLADAFKKGFDSLRYKRQL